ncbi:unnamed protein product [Phaedon cochleariae]|uniref:Major facilitator superfamily (MFS) profile domain-containing protein n=1 Tax=Phaedon cochleariae TaxID=80249 RepID=A0A9N9SG49_PHACE|nr:unnamed protein product [Phaedon cochleariae]
MTSTNIFEGTFPQLVAVLTGTLAAISDGMQYGWTAPVIPILLGPDSPVKTSKNQAEWLELLLMIGSFSGLTLTMYLVDKIGRKRSILLSSFVTLIVWIVIAVAPRIEYIFVARLFAGAAGNMAFVATPMYIAEIADQKIRGFLSSIIYLMMLNLPTRYLLFRDQPEAARSSLKRLRPASANVEKELEDIQQAVERQRTERGRIQDLVVVASNRRAILIMTILNGAQHFSSISVFLMNLHVILEAAGSIYIDSSIAAIIFSFIMLVAATMASLSIDKYGRKTLLISSSISTGLCLLVIAIYFTLKSSGYDVDGISWIPIVSVMMYACAFKLGLGMVPIVLTAELFPTKMKAIGMTLADGIYVIAAVASLQIYQQLGDRYGLQYPFYVFSGSCFVAALFTYFLIPETKGKTLEQIQYILKGIDGPPKAENTSA